MSVNARETPSVFHPLAKLRLPHHIDREYGMNFCARRAPVSFISRIRVFGFIEMLAIKEQPATEANPVVGESSL